MITEDGVLEIFKETGAFLEGHFLLSSGKHSGNYLQCAKVLQHPGHSETLCRALAGKFADLEPTVVISPAIGGVLVSYEVARHINGSRALFTERKDSVMMLRRGFELSEKDRVVVVEDVVTTAKSLKEVIEVIKKYGARIVGVGSIIDRGNAELREELGLKSLLKLDIPAWDEGSCPLCKQNMPIVKPGSRENVKS